MKFYTKLLLLIISLVLFSGALYAQDRTIVTLGGSWWNAAYSYEDKDGKKLGDFGQGNSVGPYISISHGKLNFGASMLFGSFPVDQYGSAVTDFYDNLDMSRSDLNFTLGYRLGRYINVFLGAKYINWKLSADYDATFYGITGYDFFNEPVYGYITEKGSFEYIESGMMYGLGISGVVPLGTGGFYLFGSLAGMGGTLTDETKYEVEGQSFSEEGTSGDIAASLAAINLGVGYRFPSGFGVNAGYRADLFGENVDNEEFDTEDLETNIRVQGLIITASYSF